MSLILGPHEGEGFDTKIARVRHLVGGDERGGKAAIIEYVAGPGFAGPALHHHPFEESFSRISQMPSFRRRQDGCSGCWVLLGGPN